LYHLALTSTIFIATRWLKGRGWRLYLLDGVMVALPS
jgi:hypothetical protein